MNLIPNDDQQEIVGMAARYLASELPLARFHAPTSRGADAALHRAFGAMGWLTMTLPTDIGGSALTIVEEMLVLRELGRVIGSTSIITAILTVKLAHALGLADLRDTVASGEAVAAVAFAEERLTAGATHVTGRARLYGDTGARTALVEVGDEVLLLDCSAAPLASVPWLDPETAVATVGLSAFPILGRAPAAVTRLGGTLLTAAMLLGLAEAANAMIVEYAKMRETFGRRIGAYQAVRHPIAEGAARNEQAKALLFYAALAAAEGRDDAAAHVHAAKVLAHRTATRNADLNIQLHGAIGVTRDLPAHRFMKRAMMLGHWFGDRKVHLDALLDQPLLAI